MHVWQPRKTLHFFLLYIVLKTTNLKSNSTSINFTKLYLVPGHNTLSFFGHTEMCKTSLETIKVLLLFVYAHNNNKTLCFL